MRSLQLREDLEKLLEDMPEEEDWYYGGAVRLEGRALLQKGATLEEDRKTLETEAAVKIHKISADRDEHVKEREEELEREKLAFHSRLAQQNDRIDLDIELRRAELEQTKVVKKKEFQLAERAAAEEFGAAPTDLIQDHRNQLLDIDDQIISEKLRMENYRDSEAAEARTMFDRSQMIKRTEMERRKAIAGENIARIREDVATKVKDAETDWQGDANRWLTLAKRKVAVKKREDEEAREGKRKRKGGV